MTAGAGGSHNTIRRVQPGSPCAPSLGGTGSCTAQQAEGRSPTRPSSAQPPSSPEANLTVVFPSLKPAWFPSLPTPRSPPSPLSPSTHSASAAIGSGLKGLLVTI